MSYELCIPKINNSIALVGRSPKERPLGREMTIVQERKQLP